jgi:hypothetical protein
MLNPRIVSLASSGLVFLATAVTAQLSRQDLEPRDGACFYENFDYSGNSFCVGAGESLEAMPRGMNDRVSSIRTFGRSAVTVYRDDSFSGGSVRFDGDVPDLRQANWNDRISSVQVRATSYGYRGGYSDRSARNANRIVRGAYRDVLGREPDAEGLQYYRNRIIDEGWSEAQVRQDLRRSNEYKTRTSDAGSPFGMTRTRAQSVVRSAYRSVLNREPDPASEGYVEHVLRDGWSQADVERDLRRSAEYRYRTQ